jgi:anti-sigma regulatory factor (Ser/Thr protein kinase)
MAEKAITISNQITQLEVLANAMENISEEWDIPMNISLSFNLVLEELVTNIIFYGYDDKNDHEIRIGLSYDNNIMQIQIEDDGREFNPLLMAEPDLDVAIENRKIGGLGIHFVRKIMDDIIYLRSENKNILTMKKNIV